VLAYAYIVLSVAGGFMNTHLAEGFYWLEYMSIFSYSLSALATIEFQYGTPLRYIRPKKNSCASCCRPSLKKPASLNFF